MGKLLTFDRREDAEGKPNRGVDALTPAPVASN